MLGHVTPMHCAASKYSRVPASVLVAVQYMRHDRSHWLLPYCSGSCRQYMEAAQSLLAAHALSCVAQ